MKNFFDLFFEKRQLSKKGALFSALIFLEMFGDKYVKILDTLWVELVIWTTISVLLFLIYRERRKRGETS
ncbi:hypothetical protein [Priestia koreensis]|uniref:hypothetical protein n=1 Tax=Priestia koreensis TaxID=284581 RepID=UPI0034587CD0